MSVGVGAFDDPNIVGDDVPYGFGGGFDVLIVGAIHNVCG